MNTYAIGFIGTARYRNKANLYRARVCATNQKVRWRNHFVDHHSKLVKDFQSGLLKKSMSNNTYHKPTVRLKGEIEDRACENLIEGSRLEDIAKEMGMSGKSALIKYISIWTQFAEKWANAKLAACEVIEDEVKTLMDQYSTDAAKVQLEILTRRLKWINPQKYSERQQIDLNMTVDIAGSLDKAEKRLRDATKTAVKSNVIQLKPKPDTPE